tara:strand:+ start:224 stop:514 length:291 start_codon:yes stop_codon:yes gene_type:complete
MEYLVNNKKFTISYKELKSLYNDFVNLTDEEFKKRLPEVIHFACICAFLKEIPTSNCLSDEGVIHQLAHLLHLTDEEPLIKVAEIREQFNKELKLA